MDTTQPVQTIQKIDIDVQQSWQDVTVAGASRYTNSGGGTFHYWLSDASNPPLIADIGKGTSLLEGDTVATPDALQKIWVQTNQQKTFKISATVTV